MAFPREDFESIVRAYQAMLYRIAFNFFRNVHAAEEVVQGLRMEPGSVPVDTIVIDYAERPYDN